MQSEAPENKTVGAVVKIDRRELLATFDWLEKASKWFRYNVEWARAQHEEHDSFITDIGEDIGIEDILFKTPELDGFMRLFDESIETLQALKPDSHDRAA